jgi:hypothetical protein
MDPVGDVNAAKLNARHWLLVIILDVLILAELTAAMYVAAAHPDNFTPVFMKTFFGMLLPTLLLGLLAKRMVRTPAERIKS